MKLKIPNNCRITNETIIELKKFIKYLIQDFEEKYKDKYKIYLYAGFLRIRYKQKNYYVTIVEYNQEYFWYIMPFFQEYLLMRFIGGDGFDLVFHLIDYMSL